MKRFCILLALASVLIYGGCVTESSDNHPKPVQTRGHGMSPGAEAQTGTGAR